MFGRNEIGEDYSAPTRRMYPWTELEEYSPDGGMWAIPGPGDRQTFIDLSAELMSDPGRFADAMRRALVEWPKSCMVAFSTPGLNHRAWMGHAGCYLATGSPEETTRLGWHLLDDGEQFAANDAADTVIAEWRRSTAAHHQPSLFGEFYA